ncbi:MAG TPA: phosphatidate cytidylyltransferase [Kofleriaceae bacterium]|nr:phosphatidate cytidylyltransferase [Kofleriaceae bacterium]
MALGNLAQRFAVAIVAVPLLLLLLHYHRPEPTWAVIFIASLIAMHEFFAMTLPSEDRVPALVMGALASAAFYWLDFHTAAYFEPHGKHAEMVAGFIYAGNAISIVLAVIVPGLYYLFRFRDITTVAGRYAATVAGIIYAGFLFTFLSFLKRIDPNHGGDTVVLVLIVAWVADTGGYFAGRFLGKAKLYEAVSPKKTWAGLWGGIAGAVVGVIALKLVMEKMGDAHSIKWLTWFDVFAIAIPGCLLGQMGDLAESLIKRSTGVKDSGTLLPGHGGIHDRIDAVLFIAPYVYVYIIVKYPAFYLLGSS